MNENNKPIKHLSIMYPTIGELPSSYLASMTYEEQLIYLCRKLDEVIGWANNQLSEELRKYIEDNFNDMMLNALYDSETETLQLYMEGENE